MRIVWHEWKRKQGNGYWFHQTPSIFRHEATKTRNKGEKNIICFIVFGKFQYEPWDKVSITASLNVQKNIVCSSVDANLAAILVVIVIEEYYLTVRCLKLEGRNIVIIKIYLWWLMASLLWLNMQDADMRKRVDTLLRRSLFEWSFARWAMVNDSF